MLSTLAVIALLQARTSFPVENMDIRELKQAQGQAIRNKTATGNPLTVFGAKFERGIGTESNSVFAIDLNGPAQAFIAQVGIDDEVGKKGSVVFQIWGDGKLLSKTGLIRGGERADTISANLKGVQRLVLVVTDAGDGSEGDHANWLRPELFLLGDARSLPKAVPLDKAAVEQILKLAELEKP